jgi:hypothetical protein
MTPEEFAEKQSKHREIANTLQLLNLDFLIDFVNEVSKAHFGNKFEKEIPLLGFDDAFTNHICRALALQHSEISETLEDARKPEINWYNLLEEQADVFIRILDNVSILLKHGKAQGFLAPETKFSEIVLNKTKKNIERPISHGGKRF